MPSALIPVFCQLLHPTGCRTWRKGSRQGQGSQEKEMKTSSFNINCVFSCPCLIYTPRFCLLSDQQCLSCRAQPSLAARSSIRFFCALFKHYLGRVFSLTSSKRLESDPGVLPAGLQLPAAILWCPAQRFCCSPLLQTPSQGFGGLGISRKT